MNPMIKTAYVLLFLLAASATLSAAILVVDQALWVHSLYHAYSLISFAAVDLVLMVLLFIKPDKGLLSATIWGATKFVFLVGNIFFGVQFGVTDFTQKEFTEYLLGLSSGTHSALHSHDVVATRDFYQISPYAYDILVVIQPLIAIASILGLKRARQQQRGEQVAL